METIVEMQEIDSKLVCGILNEISMRKDSLFLYSISFILAFQDSSKVQLK